MKDDTLSKLADKYLGNVLSWPAVMALTNAKAAADKSYAKIANADLIEVGMKLYIPDKAEAEKFMATYDPSKPELLFAGGAKGKLVVGSWWTAGGEAEGLKGMFSIYGQKYPNVEIINATDGRRRWHQLQGRAQDPPDRRRSTRHLPTACRSGSAGLQPREVPGARWTTSTPPRGWRKPSPRTC